MKTLFSKRSFWAGALAALLGPAAWLAGLTDGGQATAVAVGGVALMRLAAKLPDGEAWRR